MRDVTIGETIQYLRTRKGMSARGLSRAAGVSPSYVSKVESGSIEPSFRAFCRIADVLGMSEGEIILVVRLGQQQTT